MVPEEIGAVRGQTHAQVYRRPLRFPFALARASPFQSMPVGFAGFGRDVAADSLGLLVHIIERGTKAAHAGETGDVVIGIRHLPEG